MMWDYVLAAVAYLALFGLIVMKLNQPVDRLGSADRQLPLRTEPHGQAGRRRHKLAA